MSFRTCQSGPVGTRCWHGSKTYPKVKRFVVIDDEDDELDQLPLFQPSASNGLTEKIATGIANYLAGKTDEDMRCNAVVRVVQNIKSAFKGHEG